MKKFISLMLVMLMMLVLFTGCVRARVALNVKGNGKIDVTINYAISKSIESLSGQEASLDAETIAEYEAQGYTCTPYSDDEYTGYVLTKKDVSDFKDGLFNNEASLTRDGSKYILDIPWDSSDEDSDAASLQAASAMITSQGGYAEVVVTLPVKPTAHNASYVSEDGKTLTWNLLLMGSKSSVHLEYSIGSMIWYWVIRIAVAFLILILLIVAIILIVKLVRSAKKKKANASSPVSDELREYKRMLDENLITQEEYDQKKAAILNIKTTAETAAQTVANEQDVQSGQ